MASNNLITMINNRLEAFQSLELVKGTVPSIMHDAEGKITLIKYLLMLPQNQFQD
jgi:hypothetical protein